MFSPDLLGVSGTALRDSDPCLWSVDPEVREDYIQLNIFCSKVLGKNNSTSYQPMP